MKARSPILGRRIRFAVVGCGRIFERHVQSIRGHDADAELVAICDSDPTVLARHSQALKIEEFATLRALLDGSDADVVVLTTPSGLHAYQSMASAAAGRHVVTEKPMATRWDDGKQMVQVCAAAGVHLFVVKQLRYNATLQLVKKAIEGQRFGRIHMVAVNVFWSRPESYYDESPWRGTWDSGGGALMNQASHYVDLLDWLIGPVAGVHAFTATLGRKIDVEDAGVASIRWRSGTLGSLSVTLLTHPKNLEASLTILGENGTARVGGVAVNEITHWEFADAHPDDATVKRATHETTSAYRSGHWLYYENVIEVLRGQAQAQTGGQEGLRSLELLTAMYRSAREARVVSLPLDGA